MEQAADEGFDCSACQPYVVKPVGGSLPIMGMRLGEEGGMQGSSGHLLVRALPPQCPWPLQRSPR